MTKKFTYYLRHKTSTQHYSSADNIKIVYEYSNIKDENKINQCNERQIFKISNNYILNK